MKHLHLSCMNMAFPGIYDLQSSAEMKLEKGTK